MATETDDEMVERVREMIDRGCEYHCMSTKSAAGHLATPHVTALLRVRCSTMSAPACRHYLPGLPIRVCGSTRLTYSCRYRQATRRCEDCRNASRVDVAADVPRSIRTREDWEAWWAIVDEKGL